MLLSRTITWYYVMRDISTWVFEPTHYIINYFMLQTGFSWLRISPVAGSSEEYLNQLSDCQLIRELSVLRGVFQSASLLIVFIPDVSVRPTTGWRHDFYIIHHIRTDGQPQGVKFWWVVVLFINALVIWVIFSSPNADLCSKCVKLQSPLKRFVMGFSSSS